MSHPNNNANVYVVIPAFNEDAVIRPIVDEVLQHHYIPVIVDDGSVIPLDELFKGRDVYVLRHVVNLGQGAALQTGIDFALSKSAEYIVTFDADGQHKAADIEKLIIAMNETGAEIALGSRFLPGAERQMPGKRKIILQLARYLNFIFTGLLLTDAHNGLRAMKQSSARKIRLNESGMAHATEILTQIKKKKIRYIEVPVSISYTEYSISKGQNLWSGFRIFFDLLLSKFFK